MLSVDASQELCFRVVSFSYLSSKLRKEMDSAAKTLFSFRTLKMQRANSQSRSPACATTLFQSSSVKFSVHGDKILSTSSPLSNAATTSTSSGFSEAALFVLPEPGCLCPFCCCSCCQLSHVTHTMWRVLPNPNYTKITPELRQKCARENLKPRIS